MRLIILAACLWFITSCLHAKIVFTSRRDSNFMEVYTMNSDGKRDRIVVATLDMNLLSVVAEAGVPIPQWWRFTPSAWARTVGTLCRV